MNTEVKETVTMPVCPYCKVTMRPQYFRGHYDSFHAWACECETIPAAEEVMGSFV